MATTGTRLVCRGFTEKLSDAFARADTAGGTLGTAPTGQAWALTGTGVSVAQISSGRYVCPNENVYAYVDSGAPASRMYASVSWTGVGAVVGRPVLISSPYATLLETMVHTQFAYDGWNLQVRVNGGSFDVIGSGSYAARATDGTAYTIGVSVNSDTVTLELPDGTTARVTDSRVSDCYGQWTTYQLSNSAVNINARFESVNSDWMPA